MAAVAACAALAIVLAWPVTTHQGVDFEVYAIRLPLGIKALEFLDRHYCYRALARAVTTGAASDEERARRLLAWTHAHIKPVPAGLPVVDDHVWHIIIRGYGLDDQANDVFTMLCVYAGVPAYWRPVSDGPGGPVYTLSFVKLGGQWAVVDAPLGRLFTDAQGRPVTARELAAHPELASREGSMPEIHGRAYEAYLPALAEVQPPAVLRAKLQMPGFRLWYELARRIGLV